MSMYAPLDRLHHRVVRIRALQYFTAINRLLLAIGFIPSGLTKIRNERFTQLGIDTSVGFFFEAFYRSGIWYQFVGWAQVLAAVLLLIPRTAPIGAMLYLPIIVNVALITIGVGFSGTPFITVAMTLAACWLVCWEYDKWRALLPGVGRHEPIRSDGVGAAPYARSATLFALAGLASYGVVYLLNLGNMRSGIGIFGFPVLATAGALFGVLVAFQARAISREVDTTLLHR